MLPYLIIQVVLMCEGVKIPEIVRFIKRLSEKNLSLRSRRSREKQSFTFRLISRDCFVTLFLAMTNFFFLDNPVTKRVNNTRALALYSDAVDLNKSQHESSATNPSVRVSGEAIPSRSSWITLKTTNHNQITRQH